MFTFVAFSLTSLSVDIKLINILGHIGLEGNDIADKLANHTRYSEVKYQPEITYQDQPHLKLRETSYENRGNDSGIMTILHGAPRI